MIFLKTTIRRGSGGRMESPPILWRLILVMQLPSRPMSILIACRDQNEGSLLKMGLQETLAPHVKWIETCHDPKEAFNIYKKDHPDVLLIFGFSSGYSEALIINARNLDGKRHTGIVVMAPLSENFDRLAVNNYNAGADDVVSANLSLAIMKSKIITVFNHKLAADELRSVIHKLQAMTLRDELTGLANMRGFLKRFAGSIKECEQGPNGLAVIMMDLDKFKRINDTMNHMVGSHIIKSVGHILGNNPFLDPQDFAARYGGDEFIAVLHGPDAKAQMAKADKIRKLVEAKEFKFQEFDVKITCSIGLCWVQPKLPVKPEDIVKGADAMLYKSKDAGRNTVTGMSLRYPIDFNSIGRTHLIEWKSESDLKPMPKRNNG
jgi:diguanylate cyclase (GGDEF)-like protein